MCMYAWHALPIWPRVIILAVKVGIAVLQSSFKLYLPNFLHHLGMLSVT